MKPLVWILTLLFCTGFTVQQEGGYLLQLVERDKIFLANNNVTKTVTMSAIFTNSTEEDTCFDITVISVDEVYRTEHSAEKVKIPKNSTVVLVQNEIFQLFWLTNGDLKVSDTKSGFLQVPCD